MPDPLRGEIWRADLGSGEGHEQSGLRPVLIVSEDAFNSGPAGLIIVVPVTSKVAKSRHISAHVPVMPPEGGLKTASVILNVSHGCGGNAPPGSRVQTILADGSWNVLRLLLNL